MQRNINCILAWNCFIVKLSISQKLFFQVTEQLKGLANTLQTVRDIAAREVARRTEASQDLVKHLPADILSLLTTMDEQEATQVQARDDAHQRFVTLVEKFLAKFVTELSKYQERMDELVVSVMMIACCVCVCV